VKQVLFGRLGSPEDLVDLAVEQSTLTLVATGTSVEVPVVSESTESVSITVGDLAKLKKISATYKAGPVRIRIGDGRIRFQNTSIGASISEPQAARRVIDIPNDASCPGPGFIAGDISLEEIEACGLHTRVAKRCESIMRMRSAMASMGELGFTRGEVSAMVDAKIKSHAETTRHVLFPDERTLEGASSQDPRNNTSNDFEQPEPGGIQMNEAEMKAELERLRQKTPSSRRRKRAASPSR
jgi:hypothetical protein